MQNGNFQEILKFKYKDEIDNASEGNFTFAYMTRYIDYGNNVSNIHMVKEVKGNNEDLKAFLKYKDTEQLDFLSPSGNADPNNPVQTLALYTRLLGCTLEKPCFAKLTDEPPVLRLYSNDGSKLIRVSQHEYTLKDNSMGLHFHYYEIGGDFSINYRFNIDKYNQVNHMFTKTAKEIQNIMLPEREIWIEISNSGIITK